MYAVDSNALKVMHFSKGLVAKNKQYTGFYFTIRVWPVCVQQHDLISKRKDTSNPTKC